MLRVSEQDGHRRREGFVSSYRQLGASLLDLQEAADRVFDTISQRIAEESDKLAEISERIQKAKMPSWIFGPLENDPNSTRNCILGGCHNTRMECATYLESSLKKEPKAGIDAMSSSKGSLIIRSPSKYPSISSSERDFRPLFGYEDGSAKFCLPLANILVDGGLSREFGLDGTLELFQFFSEANIEDFQKEGNPKM